GAPSLINSEDNPAFPQRV
nr:Chain A, Rubrivinodin [Rubrivivax gelatinosus IL144]